MSDSQFKAFIRSELKHLEQALEESPDNETIKDMIERYRKNLES